MRVRSPACAAASELFRERIEMIGLLKSKKFVAAFAAVVVAVVNHYFPLLDEATLTKVVYAAMAYVIGQGLADVGKEATKAEAARMQATQL